MNIEFIVCCGVFGRSFVVCKIEYCSWVLEEMDIFEVDFFIIKLVAKINKDRVWVLVKLSVVLRYIFR